MSRRLLSILSDCANKVLRFNEILDGFLLQDIFKLNPVITEVMEGSTRLSNWSIILYLVLTQYTSNPLNTLL